MSQNGEYRALDDITAVQTRPGQFIGSTEVPDHLATEIVDNALDEISNGFANTIKVHIGDNGDFWVSDNGRGIDVYDMELKDGTSGDSVISLCTVLHSGSKFDTDTYETLIGMHGVGLVAVNALSDWLLVKTRDRKRKTVVHQYLFQNAQLVKKEELQDKDYSYSTLVGFKPSEKFFDSIEFNPKFFAERLVLVKAKFPESEIIFNNSKLPNITFDKFIRSNLKLNGENTYMVSHTDKKGTIEGILTFVNGVDAISVGEVNLRLCEGTFLTSFQTELKKSISEKIDKKFKNIPQTQLLSGLRLFVSLRVPEPKFDSQTKVRMTLPVKKFLIDPLKEQIDWVIGQDEIIKTIEKNLEGRFLTKITKKSKTYKKKIKSENKIKDCLKIPGETLYILEGDSALGTLKQIRDINKEAIFPLKGKVLNVESNSLERISKNKEIQDLLEALGPKNRRRYENVRIIADADVDGAHIVVLVLLLLQKYAADMIKSGNVFVVIPPLHGATKGKKFYPIYTDQQMDKYTKEGYTIQRFKGLGEMSPAKLEPIIRSGFEYKVTWPDDKQALKNIISVVTDTNVKRAIMNSEKCTFNNIIGDVIDQLKQRYATA